MKPFALALAAMLALSAPVAAQSMSFLLPSLSFPDGDVTSSTKGCDAKTEAAVCQIDE